MDKDICIHHTSDMNKLVYSKGKHADVSKGQT